MLKIVHLIPYDGIGGVEIAARTMQCLRHDNIDFKIQFIYEEVTSAKQRGVTYNPFRLLSASMRIAANEMDLLIVSLWRSYVVGLVVKLFRPDLKLIVFIHLNKDSHCLDFFFMRLATYFSVEIWADSSASLRERLSGFEHKKKRVISFVTWRYTPLPQQSVKASFIFWGRISLQKGLDQALIIFSKIYARHPDAVFSIVGPDGDDIARIHRLCDDFGLTSAVNFLGGMNMDDIIRHARNASFFLQTSLFEGMAMSVVEAMQLGLVPVVTSVGEIGAYCQHGRNALIVDFEYRVVDELLALLNNDVQYQLMRKNAVETWQGKPLYKESVIQACDEIFGLSRERHC
ncbi:MAG: glycosyltransferase [Candidatus Electrothrix sp. AR4]|nr:glycosyltransferase [Candidatus Electrothrix sp. AR4]